MEGQLCVRRNIAAWCRGSIDIENACIKINRVVYTRLDIVGRHNEMPPEMAPVPILLRQHGDVAKIYNQTTRWSLVSPGKLTAAVILL